MGILTKERKQEIKTNLLKWVKNLGYAIIPFLIKKVEDKAGVDVPEIPKKDETENN